LAKTNKIMELIREIIYPTENNYTIHLPDELIGKEVEVIAFEIEKTPKKLNSDKTERLKDLQSIFKKNRIDLTNFKFDRDEANNYDE
jgi:hypothetical protein